MRIHLIALLLAGLFSTIGMSQPVYERHTYEVYPFLARMAQKGLLEWNDNIRPILKTDIVRALDTLANQKDKLSNLEKAELAFYQSEYSYESRKRLFGIANENFNMRALPVFSGNLVKEGDRTMFRRSIGMQAFGQVGKKWGYQLFFKIFLKKARALILTEWA